MSVTFLLYIWPLGSPGNHWWCQWKTNKYGLPWSFFWMIREMMAKLAVDFQRMGGRLWGISWMWHDVLTRKFWSLQPWKLTWHWKLLIFNRKYVFIWWTFPPVMLVFGGVHSKGLLRFSVEIPSCDFEACGLQTKVDHFDQKKPTDSPWKSWSLIWTMKKLKGCCV